MGSHHPALAGCAPGPRAPNLKQKPAGAGPGRRRGSGLLPPVAHAPAYGAGTGRPPFAGDDASRASRAVTRLQAAAAGISSLSLSALATDSVKGPNANLAQTRVVGVSGPMGHAVFLSVPSLGPNSPVSPQRQLGWIRGKHR
jgi:hypothetical protein